jgi:hypothetical protein
MKIDAHPSDQPALGLEGRPAHSNQAWDRTVNVFFPRRLAQWPRYEYHIQYSVLIHTIEVALRTCSCFVS